MFRYYSEYNDTIIASLDRISLESICRCSRLHDKRAYSTSIILDHLTDTDISYYVERPEACKKCKLNPKNLQIRKIHCIDCYVESCYYDQLCNDGKRILSPRCCNNGGYPHLSIYIYTGVTVQVCGSPIKSKPNDVTYRVRIWESKDVPENECQPNYFTDDDLVIEFSISPTDDPIDLERLYGQYLRKYDVLNDLTPVDYTFSAPTCKKMYIEQFQSRINTILDICKNGPDERKPMENGHVMQRRKGYSHIV